MIELFEPKIMDEKEVLEMVNEYLTNNSKINGSRGLLKLLPRYDLWLKSLTEKNINNLVDSTYLAKRNNDNKVIGFINIRHELDEEFLLTGGHIGYSVRPSERNKEYATMMLKIALEKCYKLGIEKVLVTCNKSNPASRKVILKNGGIFENEVLEDNGEIVERYFIMKNKY